MKKILLTFSDGKIRIVSFFKKKGEWVEGDVIEDDYVLGKLVALLEKARKELKTSSLKVLLPEEKIRLDLISFPADAHLDREKVFKKAQEQTNAELDVSFFDWKWVETNREETVVQFLGVEKEFISLLIKGTSEAKVKLLSLLPESYAFARQFEKEPRPVLIETPQMTVASWHGNVFACLQKKGKTSKQSENFKKEVEERWGIELTEKKADLPAIFGLLNNLSAEETTQGIKVLSLLNGLTDTDVLIVPPASQTVTSKKTFRFGVGLLLILGLIGGGLMLVIQKKQPLSNSEGVVMPTVTENTLEPTLAPTPSPAEELSKTISIQVLNGSGQAGVARRSKDYLTALGFENVEIGNAGKYDYKNTIVSCKPSLSEAIGQLVKLLDEEYVVSLGDDLEETSKFDVIVIVGLS